MRRIEIYGYLKSKRTAEAESFCRRMGYASIMRNLAVEGNLAELRLRGGSNDFGALPQIFISEELIGSYEDLLNLSPFIVQQKISG